MIGPDGNIVSAEELHDSWLPGQVFSLDSREGLNKFETEATAVMLPPQSDPETEGSLCWETRLPLDSLVIPSRFYGRLVNFTAMVTGDPVEYLAKRKPQATKDLDWAQDHTIGFRVLADLYSSGRGIIGSVNSQVVIWQRKYGPRSASFSHFGEYGRVVEKPTKAEQDVTTILNISKSIGSVVTGKAIKNAVLVGFETSRRSS